MIVDAHHHLWDLGAVDYPWLAAKGAPRFFGDPSPIQRDYRRADFVADWDGVPVAASVHVQAGAAPHAAVAETRFADAEGKDGVAAAIVAHADLTAPDLDAVLDAHQAASPRFRGVRHLVSLHASEDAARPALLPDPRFGAGLGALAARGLSFDLQLSAPLLAQAADVFAAVPGLRVALCHCGSPWDRSAIGLAQWRHGLAAFARVPGAVAKLSGFGMFDHAWTAATMRPLVEGVLAAFGPERTMWGSNYPVEKLRRPYRALFESVRACVDEGAGAAVFGGTAQAFYRLV